MLGLALVFMAAGLQGPEESQRLRGCRRRGAAVRASTGKGATPACVGNDEYAARRSDIRQRTIKSVLRAQRKMREEGVKDVEYGVKVLARLSEAMLTLAVVAVTVFTLSTSIAVILS